MGLSADGTPFYVPRTLPGETVRAHALAPRGEGWVAEADSLLIASPDRVEPPCPHFGICGGCTLQHWHDEPYAAWKAGLVLAALRRAGYADIPLAPLGRTPPAARRRMDLALRRMPDGVVIGLHEARGSTVVDMRACPVLHPTLLALVAALRPALRGMAGLRREGSAAVNLLDSGADLLLRTDAPLSTADRSTLTELARAQGLTRIAWARGTDTPETVCLLRPPVLTLSGMVVTAPPGTFLQASPQGQDAIIAAVLAALPTKMVAKARIVELFAGIGTISAALATRARVCAFEGDADAAAALRRASGGRRIDATLRDLARQPLLAKELAGAAAIVLDPPFAGAATQMPHIAAAAVPCVIYVSCNPTALARDAQALYAAGYRIASAVPIDQFLWSARVEAVVAFVLDRRATYMKTDLA